MNIMKQLMLILTILISGFALGNQDKSEFDVDRYLDFSTAKVLKVLEEISAKDGFPRSVKHGEYAWSLTGMSSWTSGFFPGLLWYLHEYSGDDRLLKAAGEYSQLLAPLKELDWKTHDLGFMMYCSVGNGYRVTGKEDYKQWLLQTADSLAVLYNPRVGTILSWPWMKRKKGWLHNTIIDNMMNLELLFWAAKTANRADLYDIAVSHACTTLKNHFRDDYSAYHVVVYDSVSPNVLQRVTDQGYADESAWSRGQAWAIYGYTMSYRETGLVEFREAAIKISDFYLEHLPIDYVPYWDFKLQDFSTEEKDASAAAIAASGLLELSERLEDPELKSKYFNAALSMLKNLSSEAYLSTSNMAILNHSVGSKPHGSEVDVPLIYADYYYVEALMRLKKIMNQSYR